MSRLPKRFKFLSPKKDIEYTATLKNNGVSDLWIIEWISPRTGVPTSSTHYSHQTIEENIRDKTWIITEDLTMKPRFTKTQLTTGMRVKNREGTVYIVVKDIDLLIGKEWMNISSLSENLMYLKDEDLDIVEVYSGNTGYYFNDLSVMGTRLWFEEVETETQKQIRELKETITKAQEQITKLEKEAS